MLFFFFAIPCGYIKKKGFATKQNPKRLRRFPMKGDTRAALNAMRKINTNTLKLKTVRLFKLNGGEAPPHYISVSSLKKRRSPRFRGRVSSARRKSLRLKQPDGSAGRVKVFVLFAVITCIYNILR